MQVRSTWSTEIEAPPSCVAFCQSRPHLLVIGTYILHRDDATSQDDGQDDSTAEEISRPSSTAVQKRTGSVILYSIDSASLNRVQDLEVGSAILDVEWSPHAGSRDVLAVATSTGSIEIYKLRADDLLQHTSTFQISEPSILVLDLLWHPLLTDTIAATLSSGEVVLCKATAGWTTTSVPKVQTITSHTLEPWTLAFSQDGSRLFTGGDDMILQCCDTTDTTTTNPTVFWQDRKLHSAGVTAILPLQHELIVTGSYDDHIRLIFAPDVGRRQVLSELNLEGGVWRLKLLDEKQHDPTPETTTMIGGHDSEVVAQDRKAVNGSTQFIILASCMHAGVRIVRLTSQPATQRQEQAKEDGKSNEEAVEAGWHFEVLAKFEEHESMNYGSDVQPEHTHHQSVRKIVSSSFYDRRVCLWQYDNSGVDE